MIFTNLIDESIDFIMEFGPMLFYASALLFSVKHYSKYFDSTFKYLPIIIAYTFLTELLGAYIKYNEGFQIIFIDEQYTNNSIIFNIFDIVIYSYFFYIFWKSIKSQKHKNIIKYGAFLFFIACIINPLIQDFILYPQIYAIAIGSINLILCILMYFYQTKENKNKLPNNRSLLSWISIGLLIFYTAYPILMLTGLSYPDLYRKYNLRIILQALICLMYFCFSIGFIRMRRMKPTGKE